MGRRRAWRWEGAGAEDVRAPPSLAVTDTPSSNPADGPGRPDVNWGPTRTAETTEVRSVVAGTLVTGSRGWARSPEVPGVG